MLLINIKLMNDILLYYQLNTIKRGLNEGYKKTLCLSSLYILITEYAHQMCEIVDNFFLHLQDLYVPVPYSAPTWMAQANLISAHLSS